MAIWLHDFFGLEKKYQIQRFITESNSFEQSEEKRSQKLFL